MEARVLTTMDIVNTHAQRNTQGSAIVEKATLTHQEIPSIVLDAQVITCKS